MIKHGKQFYSVLLLVFLPVLVVYGIYYPGLSGPFIFDDVPNLSPMGSYPSLGPWERLWLFLNSGDAGPTGRPISLISFFINDFSWPSNPFSFKYTNLMVHLLNGVLVLWFVYKLFFPLHSKRRSLVIASLGAFIWLAHPMQVSTVLYVVQRMTELSATFTLAGLIAYLYSREVAIRRPVKGYVLMTISLVVFGLLAVFSKENGVLLILYVLVIEYFFAKPLYGTQPRDFLKWSIPVLWIPMGMLVLYMAYTSIWGDVYSTRPFTLIERLMSESRAITIYLKNILVPELGGSGLFHDDFAISRGLFNPISTAPAIVFVTTLVFAAFYFRRKFPLVSFAIAWFLAGHILESTVLPLELFFEHRNYLPLLGFVIAGVGLIVPLTGKQGRIFKISGSLIVLLVVMITASNTRTWGNTRDAAFIWAAEHPGSIRAQEVARESMLQKGRPDLAVKYVVNITNRHKDDAAAILQRLKFDCLYSSVDGNGSFVSVALRTLETARYSPGALGAVKLIGHDVLMGKCNVLDVKGYLNLLNALDGNPEFRTDKAKHFIRYFSGLSYAQAGDLPKAIESLDRAYNYFPVIDIRMQQALYLVDAGLYKEALKKIKLLESGKNSRRIKRAIHVRRKELDSLKRAITEVEHESLSVKNKEGVANSKL